MTKHLLAGASVLFIAAAAEAGECTARTNIAGKQVTLENCAVAFYEREGTVTLWFSDGTISPEEESSFRRTSSVPSASDRSLLVLSFCPGDGKPTASRSAVRMVRTTLRYPGFGTRMLRANREARRDQTRYSFWAYELPRDAKSLHVEELSGDVAVGGRLAGKLSGVHTGTLGRYHTETSRLYSWTAEFDVQLPETAATGLACRDR